MNPRQEYVDYLKGLIVDLEKQNQELKWEIGRLKTSLLKYTAKHRPKKVRTKMLVSGINGGWK